jgi:hypothetical protein
MSSRCVGGVTFWIGDDSAGIAAGINVGIDADTLWGLSDAFAGLVNVVTNNTTALRAARIGENFRDRCWPNAPGSIAITCTSVLGIAVTNDPACGHWQVTQ